MPKNNLGRPKRRQSSQVVPIGLRDDADAKAGRLEHSSQDAHRKAGMIDVGITGDNHHVQFVPASLAGFLHRHRQRPLSDLSRRPTGSGERGQKAIGGSRFAEDWKLHESVA